jgi:hypothetical protein
VNWKNGTTGFLLDLLRREMGRMLPLTPFVDELIDAIAIDELEDLERRQWTNVQISPG